jgi:hypothetical protein
MLDDETSVKIFAFKRRVKQLAVYVRYYAFQKNLYIILLV